MLSKHGGIFDGLAHPVGQALAQALWMGEENIDKTLSFYRLPRQHHKNRKSPICWTASGRRLSAERWWCGSFRTRPLCLRLVRSLAIATDENWIEAMQYLNRNSLPSRRRSSSKPRLRGLKLNQLSKAVYSFLFAELDKHNLLKPVYHKEQLTPSVFLPMRARAFSMRSSPLSTSTVHFSLWSR